MNKFLIFSGNNIVGAMIGMTADAYGAHEVSDELYKEYIQAKQAFKSDSQMIVFDAKGGSISVVDIPEASGSIKASDIKADGKDFTTISGLSIPSIVTIENIGSYFVEDGKVEFFTRTPGSYKVTIASDGMKPKEFVINAN